MSALTIKARVDATVDIHQAATEAVSLANANGCNVEFEFNGVTVLAAHGCRADDLVAYWFAARRSAWTKPKRPILAVTPHRYETHTCSLCGEPVDAAVHVGQGPPALVAANAEVPCHEFEGRAGFCVKCGRLCTHPCHDSRPWLLAHAYAALERAGRVTGRPLSSDTVNVYADELVRELRAVRGYPNP